MLNKNDPLIGAVQEVMKRNQTEREATRLVNEKFRVEDRKALPHEKQGEWDAAYQQILAEGLHPNQQKLDVHEPEKDKLTKQDFKMLRAKKKPMEEGNDPMGGDTTSPSSMGIKKKEAKVNPYAVGMAAVKKSTGDEPPMEKKNITKAHEIAKKIIAKKKMNEGFNNRHSLSVTASADKKQTVAVLNEEDIDSFENRMTAGLGQPYTPYGGGRFGGGSAKTGTLARRPVRIDPGLRNINTRTGEQIKTSSGPKTRKRVVPKKKSQEQQAVQQQGPAKPPGGTFLDNLVKARRNVGMDKTKPAANLAAGAARRPATTSNVPPIRQTVPSSGSNLPQGPWGGINRRGGARNPISSTLTAGGARRPAGQAGQSAPPIGKQGPKLPPPKSSSRIIRRGGAGLAAGAALELATSSTPVSNQPPAAAAATRTSGPSFEKTGRGNAPSAQTTTTQPDYDKMTFGQAFKSARETAKKQGDPSLGKFKYKGKEYQTNIKGTGTAKKPQEKYQLASKLKDVTPVSATQTVVKPTASPSPAPNVQSARNSTLAAPTAMAATAKPKQATFGPK